LPFPRDQAVRLFNVPAIHCSAYWPIFAVRCGGEEMGGRVFWRAGRPSLLCAVMQQQRARQTRPSPSTFRLLGASMVAPTVAPQCPKIIAPIVKRAAPIQMTTAAFFSDMIGVGFMTGQPSCDY
jgi:hypothetical protein